MAEGDWLTVAELAARLKVTPGTVRRWVKSRQVERRVIAGRIVRVRLRDPDEVSAAQAATRPHRQNAFGELVPDDEP